VLQAVNKKTASGFGPSDEYLLGKLGRVGHSVVSYCEKHEQHNRLASRNDLLYKYAQGLISERLNNGDAPGTLLDATRRVLGTMFDVEELAIHVNFGDHVRRMVPLSKREVKLVEGSSSFTGVVGYVASTGRNVSYRANDPQVWKIYQESVDIKLKRSDIMTMHSYPIRRQQDIVAVIQFICEDNPMVERKNAYNPNNPKDFQALHTLMSFLSVQLNLLFPQEKIEDLRLGTRKLFGR
jgi:hypothetical protein